MVCFSPLKAYRGPGGQVVFSSREGYLDRPLSLQCGQCIGCRVAKSREWALRCVHEASLHERSAFVTLTYRNEIFFKDGVRYGLPADGSLDVRHWQLFAKRARKEFGPFRFFHCGEYGEESFRPHYHALIFGHNWMFDRRLFRESGSGRVFTSPSLESVWGHGFVTVGDVTFQSAAYVARYCMKKLNGDKGLEFRRRLDERTGEEWYVRPEYVTMSRRPGIGADWYGRYSRDVFPDDFVIHDGRRHAVPKFYRRRLEAEDPDLSLTLKALRLQRAQLHGASAAPLGGLPKEDSGDLSPERLAVREAVSSARLRSLRRSV